MSDASERYWELSVSPHYYRLCNSALGNFTRYQALSERIAKELRMSWRVPEAAEETTAAYRDMQKAAQKPQWSPEVVITESAVKALIDGARRQSIDFRLEASLAATKDGRKLSPYADIAAMRSVVFSEAMDELAILGTMALQSELPDLETAELLAANKHGHDFGNNMGLTRKL